MNREIKFRGKRIDTGEWVYGYLADENYINDINTVDLSSVEVDPDTVGQYTGLEARNWKEIYEGDIVETFSLELEYQQKGNYPPPNIEVEEYEIVRNVGIVEFQCGSFNFNGMPIGFDELIDASSPDYDRLKRLFMNIWKSDDDVRNEFPYLTLEYFYHYNVIGNIHDNSELLEDKK